MKVWTAFASLLALLALGICVSAAPAPTRIDQIHSSYSAPVGTEITVYVKLTSRGLPVSPRKTLKFGADGRYYLRKHTNPQSFARGTFTIPRQGKNIVRVRFDGDRQYAGSYRDIEVIGLGVDQLRLQFISMDVPRVPPAGPSGIFVAHFYWRITTTAGNPVQGVAVQMVNVHNPNEIALGSRSDKNGIQIISFGVPSHRYGEAITMVASTYGEPSGYLPADPVMRSYRLDFFASALAVHYEESDLGDFDETDYAE